MMKKKLFGVVFAVLAVSGMAFAQEMMLPDPNNVIKGMMTEQKVSSADMIECSGITGEGFQLLGDSVMEKILGDPLLHERMDNMMGGEGSTSLRNMHIAMGRNWLGCEGSAGAYAMPLMMGMMGSYYPGYYSGYDALLLAAVLGWVLFAGLVLYLYPKKRQQKTSRKRK